MPRGKEFTVKIADKPGALGRCFLALAGRGVNVLGFQSYVEEGESIARFIANDMAAAKSVLGGAGMIFEETEVVIANMPNSPGALGRAASRLGEAGVNIDYSYCGFEPGAAQGLLIFGVDNVLKGAAVLDELAAKGPNA